MDKTQLKKYGSFVKRNKIITINKFVQTVLIFVTSIFENHLINSLSLNLEIVSSLVVVVAIYRSDEVQNNYWNVFKNTINLPSFLLSL